MEARDHFPTTSGHMSASGVLLADALPRGTGWLRAALTAGQMHAGRKHAAAAHHPL